MEHDDTPTTPPRPPRTEPVPAPTEGELSRIAREAVRQPADPRLDSELARMGLTEPRSRSVVTGPELERLRQNVRRNELILWALIVVVAILAVVVVILLIR